jgi:hypothetical protein
VSVSFVATRYEFDLTAEAVAALGFRHFHLLLLSPGACVETVTGGTSQIISGETMRARAAAIIAATTFLTSCVDSQRLRSNLGGPVAAAEVAQ